MGVPEADVMRAPLLVPATPAPSLLHARIIATSPPTPPPPPPPIPRHHPMDLRSDVSEVVTEASTVEFIPTIRSGSYADIGHRRDMEDEHICIDDLSLHLGSMFHCPTPAAFYGVFDGHGGPDAAAYLKAHAMRFFFDHSNFPFSFQTEIDDVFLQQVENSFRRTFFLVDEALANDCNICTSSGTTVITALIFGRTLLVANVGDCRAVLSRNGEAMEMSRDHRPIQASERRRVEECGGFIDDGYLNGVLSLTRALGDWDLKLPRGSPSPLIAEPEFMQTVLTEDDEFLIIGCDGIWDVMSSQHAVSVVRRGLQRHDDPEKCARDLVLEALRLKTIDNLTVIIVCFSTEQRVGPGSSSPSQVVNPKLKCCSLSMEALCNLKGWLANNDDDHN